MDLKALQKVVDDLGFTVQKLESIGGLEELPEIIDELQKQTKVLKHMKMTALIVIFSITGVLGSIVGYLGGYKFSTQNIFHINGLEIKNYHDKITLILPKEKMITGERKEQYFLFEYKKMEK